jgi:hypothetical protein
MATMQLPILLLLLLVSSVTAQFPPRPEALEGIKTVNSKIYDGAKITYKNPGICEGTEGVRSWSGFVRFPKGALEGVDWESNM